MICYKDMTFCEYTECIKFKECPRALTQQIGEEANSINLPISRFADKPKCYEKEG